MTEPDLLNEITTLTLGDLIRKYPLAKDYLANHRITAIPKNIPFPEGLKTISEEQLEEFGLDSQGTVFHFAEFLSAFLSGGEGLKKIESLTILGGKNKSGEPENISITVQKGEILSIVGPTGSGKSRLLGDIECLAQKDTPTGRQILINGEIPEEDWRFSSGSKLVAQLSQNMNFVMDITVSEFLLMHAGSRLVANPEDAAQRCFDCANSLAGEKFTKETKVTQLSGGQSRALMIADTALMSESPVILIDEIENAGIDRSKAIELLAGHDKIILMSTHDPLLALRGTRRVVISNGGIAGVLETSNAERKSLLRVEKIDAVLQDLRNRMRFGERITEDLIPEFKE
ncbi:MAG TPA: ATP-binding cassette domain-containing protein [Methanocorpusculum sp.]|nr:ATP-binding cassette domain-containing protein [Methanocorpusculum sp.]